MKNFGFDRLSLIFIVAACSSQNTLKDSGLRLQHDIRFYGQYELPASMHEISGATVAKDTPLTLALVSDDAGQDGLGAHYYLVSLNLERGKPLKMNVLSNQSIAVPPGSVDLEAIAFDPKDSSLLLSSEGAKAPGGHSELLRIKLDGNLTKKYQYESAVVAHQKSNKGFEAMALNIDLTTGERRVATINEQAATNDVKAGRLVFRQFELQESKSLAKSVFSADYALTALRSKTDLGFNPTVSDLGVSDMLSLGHKRFWVLERGYYGNDALNRYHNTAQIYAIDQSKTVGGQLEKKLIIDFESLVPAIKHQGKGIKTPIDNVEGLALVQDPTNFATWLLAFTDDNLSPRQRSLVYVFLIPNTLL